MNIDKKRTFLLSILCLLFAGCNSWIYDDRNDCPQGVYVNFFSKTSCAHDSTYVGEVSSLIVFAFDENERLVTTVVQNEVNLDSDYELLIPVSDGLYSFVAWVGVNDLFAVPVFDNGITTKKNIMLTLPTAGEQAVNLAKTRIWQGESEVIFLPDPNEYGGLYKRTAINLQEITNRIQVVVEFDESITELSPQDLMVSVSSANGTLLINGSMPLNNPSIHYPLQQTTYTDRRVIWDFTLLKLLTGYDNKVTIHYPKTKEIVFEGDLIASILLNTVDKGINLDCQHDFVIKFVLKDYCASCGTRFSCAIYVNDWLVHSYKTDMEI